MDTNNSDFNAGTGLLIYEETPLSLATVENLVVLGTIDYDGNILDPNLKTLVLANSGAITANTILINNNTTAINNNTTAISGKVSKSGDTMTGNLDIDENNLNFTSTNTINYDSGNNKLIITQSNATAQTIEFVNTVTGIIGTTTIPLTIKSSGIDTIGLEINGTNLIYNLYCLALLNLQKLYLLYYQLLNLG